VPFNPLHDLLPDGEEYGAFSQKKRET